jgi:hypothetical protein
MHGLHPFCVAAVSIACVNAVMFRFEGLVDIPEVLHALASATDSGADPPFGSVDALDPFRDGEGLAPNLVVELIDRLCVSVD